MRSCFDIVSYATFFTRSWRNPYWPRSDSSGSIEIESTSLRTSEPSNEVTSASGSPVIAHNPWSVNVRPRTDPSCRSLRSAGSKPSSRAAISAWRDSGTSSVSTDPSSRNAPFSRTRIPRSISIRTVSTA